MLKQIGIFVFIPLHQTAITDNLQAIHTIKKLFNTQGNNAKIFIAILDMY